MNITKPVSLQHNSCAMDLSDSPMSIADELLNTLYSGDTSPADRAEAHYVWLTWFRKQPDLFKQNAVERYLARREQNFVSMYEAVR